VTQVTDLNAPAGYKSRMTTTQETAMQTNVGGIDRILRIVVGLALISLVFVGPHTVWGWVGVIPLITGLVGWCGAYTALGISTCKQKA
jgi:hypothetical protein